MENKKLQELFSKAIIKSGFVKNMTLELKKHMSADDIKQIHVQVYEYYETNGFININEVFIGNLYILMDYFIEVEDYEKCAIIRDKLNTITTPCHEIGRND